MFEYTELVDAPVQRFTGIVTGQDPDAGPPTVPVDTPIPPVGVAMPDALAMLVVVAQEPVEQVEPVEQLEVAAPTEPETARPGALAAVRMRPAMRPLAPPTPAPSLVPALLAIAAAGLTAMWWLRRDSHDRGP